MRLGRPAEKLMPKKFTKIRQIMQRLGYIVCEL